MARQQQESRQQIAVIEEPRFAMPAHVTAEYGLTADTWRAVIDAVFPLAKTPGAVLMALAYAKKRNVDIFARTLHIVPMQVDRRTVETVWPGIALQRITGHRQPDFAGWEPCVMGPMVKTVFKGRKRTFGNDGRPSGYEDVEATVTHPEWGEMTFLKMLHGQVFKAVGPKVFWLEEYARLSAYVEVPNAMWQKRPNGQFEKVVEAAALRRAWPDVFGGEMTFEEVEGRTERMADAEYTEVQDDAVPTAEATPKKATPMRAQFAEADATGRSAEVSETDESLSGDEDFLAGDLGRATDQQHDAETGEVERGQAAATVDDKPREPGPVPEGFESWEVWADGVTTRMKVAPNIPKLEAVVTDTKADYDQAPDEIQERLRTLYQEKITDHREAMK